MSRFSAVTLDLSRFPAPLAIRGIDFENIIKQRLDRLVQLSTERGFPFNVQMLESDPAVIQQENDAYREMLAISAINDAVRAGMVAFAIGSDLEHLVAFYGLERRVITPANSNVPTIMESDAELRRRALLAPEAFATAGTHGGYVFHALTADVQVINADVWSPAAGEVSVAIQAREGGATASEEIVAAVRAHLHRPDIKPLTDVVSVRSVSVHSYAIDVEVFVQPGPDPVAVKEAVSQSLTALTAARRTPARDVPVSAITAAATVGPVDRVLVVSPSADVVMDEGELAVCTSVNVTVRTHEG